MSEAKRAVPTIAIDNERVRVTRWQFAPAAETGFHVHQWDYVVVPLVDGRLKIIAPDGAESFADLQHGVPYFRGAGVHHNVISANDGDFAFIEIELKGRGNP